MTSLEFVQPEGWEPPSGYSNGVLAPPGARLLFVAGQIAWDADQVLVGRGDFAAQFRQALTNVLAVVDAAGGEPAHLASLTVFVKDKQAYLASSKALGTLWRELVGRHYPAMALVEVADLLEKDALVEIQAIAAIG
ncbi:MAG: RidA family protein [Planctomycetes bacterium]|nr:RidA family protein [Planctomycetota bacterium]